ncbi:general transcription factor II-I repeat domain-containing protein 2-like [Ornithodoros turicata]|uniref:general transcription factor II-I repeat domain-containing protein 2-like n=1 Tax=Ornithodoros turicata TaxID=34597 RepID=UPI00313934A6
MTVLCTTLSYAFFDVEALQGKVRLITEMYDSVKGFVKKLELREKQLASKDLFHFPCLKAVDCNNEETLRTYSSAVSVLRRKFMSRFHDFEILEATFKLYADPFSVFPEDVKPGLQMELIDFQCNSTLRQKFDEIGPREFYKYVDRKSFHCLMSDVSRVLSMFGGTCVCEQCFSIMTINKSKLRSQLSDDHLRVQLRIATAVNLQVDIGNLVRKKGPQVLSAHH